MAIKVHTVTLTPKIVNKLNMDTNDLRQQCSSAYQRNFYFRRKKSKAFDKKITLKHRKVSVKTFQSLISVTSLKVVLVIILKLKTVRRDNILHSLPSRPCSTLVLSNYDSCCHCFYAMAGTQCTDALLTS